MRRSLILPLLLTLLLAARTHGADQPHRIDLFEAGKGGYALYRIPTILVTPGSAILVACEARASAGGDWGRIDLLMRRSTDGGTTWSPPRKLAEAPTNAQKNPVAVEQKLGKGGGITMNNPVAIADPASGAVHVLYCVEYARCFYMRSDDDGQSFTEPVEITAAFQGFRRQYNWRVLATGPGHAIRVSTSGRLVVPVWLSTAAGGERGHGHRPSCVATIYSDDAGKSWHAGDIIADDPQPVVNPSEATVAEISGGRVVINVRHEGNADAPTAKDRATFRGVSVGRDGAREWSPLTLDRKLSEPVCMGSLLRVDFAPKPALLFCNPDNAENHRRRNLTVRLSEDDGKSWPVKRVIDPGVSGYSDLAATADGKTLYCFYERGSTTDERHNDIAALTLVRFDREWLTSGDAP
jgi:sialidase-1